MSCRNCYHCGYFREEDDNGMIKNYCNDLDCEVDPDEPICSDENYDA